MFAVIAIGSLLAVGLPESSQAQTGGPTVVIKDITAKIIDFVNRNKDAINAKIKVAGDVAYKTALRVFYQQLAQMTFQFVSTAGSGQKPLFITSPDYFTNVRDAAQNDFLDDLERDYFGSVVSSRGTDSGDRGLALLARGILNPGTACEQQANSVNQSAQKEIQALENDKNNFQKNAKENPIDEVSCPVTWHRETDTYTYNFETPTPNVHPVTCSQILDNLLVTYRQKAAQELRAQIRVCAAEKVTTLRNDPKFNEIVGNDNVALALSELFRPEQNDLGTVLKIITDAEQKGIAVTAAERDIATFTNVQSARTLSGEVKAPGAIAQQYSQQGIDKAVGDVSVLTGSKIADVIAQAAGDALIARIGRALLNNCGLNPKACKQPTGTSPQALLLFGNRTAAQQTQAIQLGKADIVSGDPSKNPISTTQELQSLGVIDQRFGAAIDQKLTVQQALDGGYLDPNRTFGFTSNGEQPENGYPYRSILYLRQSRVIPVGWEIAAEYIQQYDRRDIGLGELVEKFNICGQDSQHDDDPRGAKTCSFGSTAGTTCTTDADCGGPTGSCVKQPVASPYCGLVDPNWVLKAPLTYCRKQGAGEEIITKIFVCDSDTNGNGRVDCSPTTTNPQGGDIGHYEIQRNPETCVDEPTCVVENIDGTCQSYGYCFEDRRTFRFAGTLCPNYYASCTSYTSTSTQETAGYLARTVQTNGCSSGNAGCQAYCADVNNDTGRYLCTGNGATVTCPAGNTCTCRLASGEACSVIGGQNTCVTGSGATCSLGTNFTYFDRDVAACNASDEGCRQFINMSSPANLLANGSFELHQPQAGCGGEYVKGWGCQQLSTDTAGPSGANLTSVVLPSGSGSDLIFTNDRVPSGLDTGRPLARQVFTMSYYGKTDSGTCNGDFGLRTPSAAVDLDAAANIQNTVTNSATYTTSWQRFTSTFYLPDGTYDNDQAKHIIQAFVRPSSCNILVDNLSLQAATAATEYVEYGTANLAYLNKTRQACSPVDVGCQQYTPVDGGEPVTGVVNWPDTCSAEYAGCRAYKKEATTHLPFRSEVDPINLTAASGRTCSAADVGCEEYTNLDIAAQGGEGKEYYSQIQQCVKPEAGSATQQTYFTWVGSDQTGFQLRSFRLKASNLSNVNGEIGTAPCTNLRVGTAADGNNPACEDSTNPASQQFFATCSAADIGVNPDCAQYFDGGGNIFYRLRSRIVPVTDDCHPYRNTIDEQAATDKVYLIYGSQSKACSAAANKCRAFTGNAGGATTAVFNDTFEGASVVTNTWQAAPGGSIALSGESVSAGGRSMRASGSFATQASVLDDRIRSNGTYVVSFWMKPETATRLTQASIQVNGTPFYLAGGSRPDVGLATDWHPYTIGPVTVTSNPSGQTVQLALTLDGSAFIDNVTMTAVNDRAYLIDDSFRTCPDSALGCTAYRDARNADVYFKSVTRLCAPTAVGCTAFIDTQNSTDPFASTPVFGVSTPGDTTVTLIDTATARCDASAKGCTAFGTPVYDVNQKITSFQTSYVKDDPDQHVQILCSKSEQFCSEYETSSGSKVYFKDPGSQTCEYKKLSGDTDFNWFITGTSYRCPVDTPPAEGVPIGGACTKSCSGGLRDGLSCVQDGDCPASNGTCVNSFCQGGARNGLSCSATSDCSGPAGSCVGSETNVGKACTTATAATDCVGGNICAAWVGVCPVEQDGCTEYRDPSDPAQCRSTCPLQVSTTSGKPIPFDESCQPTICVSGAKAGSYCSTNADCPGRCIGGTTPDRFCTASSDCAGGGTCSNVGTCSGEGFPGCRSYTYLRQTIEPSAAECNGRVDPDNGCLPFNDTSNPTLNFRGS